MAIVYHYVAHYRRSIFQHLSKDTEIDFTIISGRELDMQISTLDEKYANRPLSCGGIKWRFVKNRWFFGKLLWQQGLHNELLKQNYNVVIFLGNAYYLSTWVQAILCKFRRVKVLMWGHGMLRRENFLKRIVRRMFYGLAEGHFIYSSRSIAIMRTSGLASKKYYLINNSLDYDTHYALRRKMADTPSPFDNDNSLKLIFIGRLTLQKKLDLLILAQSLLLERGRNIHAYFIGDGSILNDLEALGASLGISDHLHFLGACYEESKLATYIYHADICISPGEVGLTAIHSLSFGTPVISHGNFDHQMPEFEAIIDGETGTFFDENSVVSLANAIDRLKPALADREKVRQACYNMIDNNYTPTYQCDVFKRGIFEAV